MHPKGRTADQTGLSWVIQASHAPSHWVFQCAHGDVLISMHPRQSVTKPGPASSHQILASSHTLEVLAKEETVTQDPLQANDPWAKKKGPFPSKPNQDTVMLAPSQMSALESKMQAHFEAKSRESQDADMEPSRLQELEQKFAAMSQQQGALEQKIDQCHQHSIAQHQQLSQTVQTLAGHVENQGNQLQRQMESTLTSHLERIEAMLSKRPKHGE